MKNGFFAMIGRMKYIARWGLMRNSLRESLSEHSFETAVIAHALAVIGRDVYKKDIDPGKIAAVGLFHDAAEILTGDLPTPVKYNNPEIREAYRSVEEGASKSLLSMLPEEMAPEYTAIFEFETDKPEFYRYVKAADKISAYVKCVEERKSGNREFELAEKQTLEAIKAMELPEADYYMEHFMQGYEYTLDELQQEDK